MRPADAVPHRSRRRARRASVSTRRNRFRLASHRSCHGAHGFFPTAICTAILFVVIANGCSVPRSAWHQRRACVTRGRIGFNAKRFQTMRKALERVIEGVDLHRTDAPVLDRHLLHWLLNASFDGAKEMLAASSAIVGKAEEFLGLLSAVEQNLPVDEGRSRPKDDDRFIIHLANQFEASGGRATASRTAYTESGYRETVFRKFVHEFYKTIPIKSRRTDGGLDEAIVHALSYRHRDSKKE
jgi:hypothetical protein